MWISQSRQTIFIHNPKTAGRSILKGFNGPWTERPDRLVHMTPDEARHLIFQENWKDFYSFTFVRNPWARLVSLYHFQRSTTYYGLFGANPIFQRARQFDFDEWIDVNRNASPPSTWFGHPQENWTRGVTEVFRFEGFDAAVETLSQRLGRFTPAHENASPPYNFKRFYTYQRHIDFVAEYDRHVIETFGYAYDEAPSGDPIPWFADQQKTESHPTPEPVNIT